MNSSPFHRVVTGSLHKSFWNILTINTHQSLKMHRCMTQIRCLHIHNCRDHLLKFKPEQYTGQLKVKPLYFQPHMGTVVTKWATQWLACSTTLHTVEAIEQFVNILNKWAIGRYSLLTTPTKTQTHEQFHTCFIVTVGQFEKYIYNNISSYFRLSYFISYENRMNEDTVPY